MKWAVERKGKRENGMGLDKIIVEVEVECRLEYKRTAESSSSEEEEVGDVNLGARATTTMIQWPSMAGSCQSVSKSDFCLMVTFCHLL